VPRSLIASLDRTTIGTAINVGFQATVEGNTMRATLDETPFTLKRRGSGDFVYMKNPRTRQVLTCAGSPKVIESCSARLQKEGWKELAR